MLQKAAQHPVVTLLTSISTFTTYLGLALLAFYRTGQQKHIGQCGLFVDRMLYGQSIRVHRKHLERKFYKQIYIPKGLFFNFQREIF